MRDGSANGSSNGSGDIEFQKMEALRSVETDNENQNILKKK